MRMRKIGFSRMLAVLMAMALCLAALSACNGSKGGETSSGDESGSVTESSDTLEFSEEIEVATPEPKTYDVPNGTKVSSVEQLLDAIAPGATIVLESGEYNLTDFLKTFSNEAAYDAWNRKHEYVEIYEEFDGLAVSIRHLDGLCISGGDSDASKTLIVTEPRYVAVFTIGDCKNVEFRNITMGHTMAGECQGNVLDFYRTQNVKLFNVDLYGCGVYGIGAFDRSGSFEVADSTIRDCSSGMLDIEGGSGDFNFTDCIFTGSEWGGYYEVNETSTLTFLRCRFGQGESNTWLYYGGITLKDCILKSPNYYYKDDYGVYEGPVG